MSVKVNYPNKNNTVPLSSLKRFDLFTWANDSDIIHMVVEPVNHKDTNKVYYLCIVGCGGIEPGIIYHGAPPEEKVNKLDTEIVLNIR